MSERNRIAQVEAEQLALVLRWRSDREAWKRTGKGPDGTRFPPSWPFSHVETADLVCALAEPRMEVAL